MKRILLLILLFINYQYSFCQKVDEELARSVASNFYQSLTSGSNLRTASTRSIQLQRVNLNLSSESNLRTSNVENNDPMFVFNVGENGGFVIVAGNKKCKPILAYSDGGGFPTDDNHPVYVWLDHMIEQQKVANELMIPENKDWNEQSIALSESPVEVGPLLGEIEWHQRKPFNNSLELNYSQNLPIGCVATAMAQIMNYYKYPLIGEGSVTYNESDGEHSPNLGSITVSFEDYYYPWHLFEDSYSSDDEAVMELGKTMFEIAASIEMDFGYNGSYASMLNIFGADAHDALELFFGYKEIKYEEPSVFGGVTGWAEHIRKEIDEGRPVLYGSKDKKSGIDHVFVCDGYNSNDEFYFNWGFEEKMRYTDSGIFDSNGNGFYSLTAMELFVYDGNPKFDFSHQFWETKMLTGIKPDFESPAIDQYEDDDNFETATNIESTTSDAITQLHSIAPIADKDYYTFNLSVTSDVTIETKGVNGNTQIWLYDESKSYLNYDDDSSNEGNGNAKLTIELPAGKYFFMVDEKGNDLTIPSYIVSFRSISIGTRNISYRDHLVKDGTDDGGEGDGDRKVETGEEIELDVELFNSGDTNAQDVRATLSTNDPDITIIDDNLPWGRINPGEGDWSSDFEFKVSYSCPTKDVTFTLVITSNEEEWTDTFIIPVYNVPTVYIADANFEQALIDEEIDTDGIINQKILLSDAESVTDDLRLENRNISNLTGLDAFKNIQRLYCEGNQITELDISNNKDLYYVHCEGNQLTELDVSKNTNLTKIKCASNQIEILNVKNNTKLEYLSCSGNPITYLDLSANTALTILNCNGTQLRSLNLKNNLELIDLGCDGNKLENLDISINTKLTNLECDDNLLTSLDLSQNSSLIELWCRRNQLTEIVFSQNSTLTILECESNQLTSLNISKNSALIEVAYSDSC